MNATNFRNLAIAAVVMAIMVRLKGIIDNCPISSSIAGLLLIGAALWFVSKYKKRKNEEEGFF